MFKKINLNDLHPDDGLLQPAFRAREMDAPVPKYEIPKAEMASRTACQLIHDELALDVNSRLNLASFVTTWMEPEAAQLMAKAFDRNMMDKDDLPEDLVFNSACLGGDLPDFSLGFSRPGSQVIAQYYNFLRLGLS